MKKLLEESKHDVPRLTPPPPTPEEVAEAQERKTPFRGTYRIRNLLPPELRGGFYFLMDGRTLEMDIRPCETPTSRRNGQSNDRPVSSDRSRSQYDPRLRVQGHVVLGGLAEQ